MKILNNIFTYLSNSKLTISFCESASGGALSNLMTSIEGSSNIFKGSIISYSNNVKKNVVKIPSHIIDQYGAVSEQTAFYMSKNTNELMGTDICLSITGNASDNVIENKEPCLYYIGITIIDKTYTYKIKQENIERNFNRLNISQKALELLEQLLKECNI